MAKRHCADPLASPQRIAELIRKKQRQRVAENLAMEKRLAQGDKVRDKNGKVVASMPQPSLPSVDLPGDDEMGSYRTVPTRSKSDMSLGSMSSDWAGEKHGYEYAQAMQDGTYPVMREWRGSLCGDHSPDTLPPAALGYNAAPDYPTYPPAMGTYPSMDSLPENAMYGGGYNGRWVDS